MASSDFLEAERKFQSLRDRYARGELSLELLKQKIATLRVQDDHGFWWQLNGKDGSWLRWEGAQWVAGDPFLETPLSQPTGPVPSVTSGTDAKRRAAEQTYRDLRKSYKEGKLGYQEFTTRVTGLKYVDDKGRAWRLDSGTGHWFLERETGTGPGNQETGLATVRFIKGLALGMKKGIARSIPTMLVSMAAVWGIHSLLTLMVKKDTIAGNPPPLIASILILPGHEAAGMLFWGLLVGLIISFVNKARHDQLPATKEKIRTTPAFVRQSFDQTGFQGLLLFLLGISMALLFAGLIANILVSLQCILFFVNTLIAQRESMMALFLQAIGSDVARGLHFPGNPDNSSIWFSAAGMTGGMGGFLVSLAVSPAQFVILVLVACIVIAALFLAIYTHARKTPSVSGRGV